ncbi:MAG: 3-phosphoshikimate 1-carboxyvinyltransferase [Bacteroidota bacterium]
MNLLLEQSIVNQQSTITITGSKSETNRLLLLQALYPNIVLENASNSDDSQVMIKAIQSNDKVVDIHHAGTAMRFLTAYYAIQDGREVVITGSSRMKERPIQILFDALRQLGAEISYEEKDGFPPLKIIGKKLTENKVTLPANVSSQYISALLLIAPKLENGLELTLEGEITSLPYIEMTLALLNEIGVKTAFENNTIVVNPKSQVLNFKFTIESDWSSASYYYSIVALSEIGTQINFSSYKKTSLQGDSILSEIYKNFGVETVFNSDNSIVLSKVENFELQTSNFELNLNNCPDLAQTIAVTFFGLGIACHLTGLHTLKIKETDRLQALKNELTKLGATVSITDNSIRLEATKAIHSNIHIQTYQDHRMAMAFAPLALKTSIIIEDANVVSKSYPNFWNDLKNIGFTISETK